MAFELTQTALNLSQKTNVEPQLILEVEGIPYIFGTTGTSKLWKFDEGYNFDAGLALDTPVLDDNSRPWITKQGTTQNVTSQVQIDRGGEGSVQKFVISLIDKNGQASTYFSPNSLLDDPLGAEAVIYLNFSGGAHPEDSIRIFTSIIDDISFGSGKVLISCAHPDQLKRQDIFQQIQFQVGNIKSYLTSNITAAQTTINISDATSFAGLDLAPPFYVRIEDESILVGAISGNSFTGCIRGSQGTTAATHDAPEYANYSIEKDSATIRLEDSEGLLSEAEGLKTYILLNEEIIRYTSYSDGDISGLTRGELSTFVSTHEIEQEGTSFYRITAKPIQAALSFMLSNNDDSVADYDIENFNSINATTYIENSILITDTFFQQKTGLVTGDLITISNATNPLNNVIEKEILNFQVIDDGTILILNAELEDETESSAALSAKSQFNLWTDGLGMKPSQVDVSQHLEIDELFGSTFPIYDFYLKDTIKGKEFLSNEIYFPCGLYSMIRKGRSSVNMTNPPFNSGQISEFNESNVKSPDKLVISRSINKYFYNNITYKYNQDSLTDKFLTGKITLSERSHNKIKIGNKPLVITSKGLRNTNTAANFISRQTRRFTERFQFGAEGVKVETFFKSGFSVEAGDAVLFGSEGLQVTDITQANRLFKPRMMEITNKTLSIFSGKISLELLDTQFNSDSRFGTFSPSSFIGTGSTTTSIRLKKSFTTGEFDTERNKWLNFIGENIRIRNNDFTILQTVRLLKFDEQDTSLITLAEPLLFTPTEDFIIDSPNYEENDKAKSIHCFSCPEINIISGATESTFEADTTNLFIGSFIRVHSPDFATDSTPTLELDDLEITDITGNNVTVNRNMGFVPSPSEVVSLIGFKSDGGVPYRYV